VFSLLSCYFGHLKLIEPAILLLLLGDVLADGLGIPSNRIIRSLLKKCLANTANFGGTLINMCT